eukprot:COSAG06_NODE_2317_length_7093_cov_3.472262_11_plen_51_part_00
MMTDEITTDIALFLSPARTQLVPPPDSGEYSYPYPIISHASICKRNRESP